ncbi:transcriptional regulator of RNA polII, SAGA, subunit-domain-containing protein [Corynascus similis CBS 632.67]|uniref:Transcriptional regulator of RNA polII, SAGA, subunit-domain-containing protein n=1 Tax=Corynascus novoguineensis TaxID=1126955 RepID=A0AAN7CVZ0_9PEZI|nr:transcriptional regulator of RNA polII, SAGA, subunit-domain-containing protein [Corynascus novoguineensis]
MVDINPAALSRPSISISTPVLSKQSINVSVPSIHKAPKTSQLIPARIDLEPIYTALKASIGAEQWPTYKESITNFLIGRLNQAEFSERIGPILASPDGSREHLHNQLIAAIYGNVTREMPDQGLAPWVSANDKPSTAAGSKPVSGDAAERRLKGEVMQLPPRDRRRIKDLAHNDFDPYESLANVFTDHARLRPSKTADVPASAGGGLSRMNFDLEIRKRYAQPLAVESGEFPDVSNIEARMLPFCYEAGLASGHAPDAAQFMSIATETFIKEVMSAMFSRTRSNPPGDSGNAGFGPNNNWIQTHKYRKQLAKEEEAFQRGEITRDKTGLLPVEAKAAGERGPLGIADLRLALEMGDCGLANFPIISTSVIYGYREGELENWDDYTYVDGRERVADLDGDVEMGGVKGNGTGKDAEPLTNGVVHGDQMDIDDDTWWEGAGPETRLLDGVLDSCLAVG